MFKFKFQHLVVHLCFPLSKGERYRMISLKQPLCIKCYRLISNNLPQSGAWGCFDEFNRINIEVLSVVAQQILSILQALGMELKRFMFEGREINLSKSVGIFITMNPGIDYVCMCYNALWVRIKHVISNCICMISP